MTALALFHAVKSGFAQIILAGLTLLPALLAYLVYHAFLSAQKPLKSPTPTKRILRVAWHVAVALFIVTAIAGSGMGCSTDENDSCIDDDWKPPSTSQTEATFARLTILVLGGMFFAARNVRETKDPF